MLHTVRMPYLRSVKPMACCEINHTSAAMFAAVCECCILHSRGGCLPAMLLRVDLHLASTWAHVLGKYELGWHSVTLQPPQQLALPFKTLM